jgi:hypothetical protein
MDLCQMLTVTLALSCSGTDVSSEHFQNTHWEEVCGGEQALEIVSWEVLLLIARPRAPAVGLFGTVQDDSPVFLSILYFPLLVG